MARTRWRNPLSFRPAAVSILVAITYIAIAAGLLYVHHVVPPAPKSDTPVAGVNITEAWRDLQTLSSGYHPFNSKKNDEVRNWLLNRIDEILSEKDARTSTVDDDFNASELEPKKNLDPAPITVFNDIVSNGTFYNKNKISSPSVYFEGTNIIVYIRGSEDDALDWWQNRTDSARQSRGVLVNAHYDSVSTGFGATDDGVGVVTILQLIKHYSKKGHQPKRGLVALLNNGEEDFLNGAYVFMRHPISRFPDTFLNLEGAGAGGRAMLFRSTDAEVTKFYGESPRPYGTVISADAFKRRVVNSETDYAVFNGRLGLRGLDVAFYEPRARYHTSEDSSRDTSRASLWHMLSAALATTKGLTSDIATDFKPGEGAPAVYFDVLGYGFGLMDLHSLFGLSVSLLVVGPIILIALSLILRRSDKSYLFAGKRESDPLDPHAPDDAAVIQFGGWKGFSRYPIAFVLASAAVVGLAYLITKINPYIVYSSQYAVWSMMLSAWFVVAWFFLRGADVMRPSALHRAHALGWIFFISWVLLAAATIGDNNFGVGSGYFMTIYFAGAFVALLVSYLEFFGLRKKSEYAKLSSHSEDQNRPVSSNRRQTPESNQAVSQAGERPESSDRPIDDEGQEATETTSLLSKSGRSTFKRFAGRHSVEGSDEREGHLPKFIRNRPFGDEQAWSAQLPSWLWAIEFLVFAPFALIFVGPVALLSTSALHQTLADGSSAFTVYIIMAVLSVLLLMPASPFIHRIASRLPTLLFLVFVATLIYNLLAFPFSSQNRLKVFFRQDLDLDSGLNRVSLTGLDGYVQKITTELPSTAGEYVNCSSAGNLGIGLTTCAWSGLAPNLFPSNTTFPNDPATPLDKRYSDWLTISAAQFHSSKSDNNTQNGTAKIKVFCGSASRASRLFFDPPLSDFNVTGAAEEPNGQSDKVPAGGTKQIRLWSREWDSHWTMHIKWNATVEAEETDVVATSKSKKEKKKTRGLDIKAECLWSDVNERGVLPAFDEVRMYMPVWSIVTKADDGLLSGSKSFLLAV